MPGFEFPTLQTTIRSYFQNNAKQVKHLNLLSNWLIVSHAGGNHPHVVLKEASLIIYTKRGVDEFSESMEFLNI